MVCTWGQVQVPWALPPCTPDWGTVCVCWDPEAGGGVLGSPGAGWGAGGVLTSHLTSCPERPWLSPGVVSDPAPSWRGGEPPGWRVGLWVQAPWNTGHPAIVFTGGPASGTAKEWEDGLGHLLRTAAFLGFWGIPGSAGSPHSAQQGQLAVCTLWLAGRANWGRCVLEARPMTGPGQPCTGVLLGQRRTHSSAGSSLPQGPGGMLIG